MPIWRLAHVFDLTAARPDQARSKQSENYSRMISPRPSPRAVASFHSALLTAHGRLCHLFNIEGILANLRQQPCFPGVFQ